MNIPGFTVEASLYKCERYYHPQAFTSLEEGLRMQLLTGIAPRTFDVNFYAKDFLRME